MTVLENQYFSFTTVLPLCCELPQPIEIKEETGILWGSKEVIYNQGVIIIHTNL